MARETDGQILERMGTDGAKWAAEFMRVQRENPGTTAEGVMISWFANAIEAGRFAGRKETCPHPSDAIRVYHPSGAMRVYGDLVMCSKCGSTPELLT